MVLMIPAFFVSILLERRVLRFIWRTKPSPNGSALFGVRTSIHMRCALRLDSSGFFTR